MLGFHPLEEHEADPARQVELLQEFAALLERDGMASMDEYGDMLKWALPGRGDGVCRYFHVFHPGFCSYEDTFFGTVHFHGGEIRGTVLLGGLEHCTYEPHVDADGDRVFDGRRYRLVRHSSLEPVGSAYVLPAMVPHWPRPTALSLTYFEEEDNGVMGDLVNLAGAGPDEQPWEQPDADALLPELMAMIEARVAALLVAA